MKGEQLSHGMAVVTVIGRQGPGGEPTGNKMAFALDWQAGELSPSWLAEGAARLAEEALSDGAFKVADLSDPDWPDHIITVMADPYLPPHELIILGGGHIAVPLAEVGKLLGYRVAVVDDRPDFASAARFPGADRVLCCSFGQIEEKFDFGPRSSVIIVTRGHQHDLLCLGAVIKYPLAYLGMIGSRRKIGAVRQQLIEGGVAPERLEAVHMPIGLDIGAQTPEEIAVSIAAEMVLERRGGSAASLRSGPPRGAGPARSSELPTPLDLEILQKVTRPGAVELPAALATITRTWGSTPRKAGSKMLVYRDGRTFGTVGGGCGESEIRREAINVIDEGAPKTYRVSLTADTAAAEGMVCGGVMEVFIEPGALYEKLLGGGERL